MEKLFGFLAVALLLLSACATPNTMLVDPHTGEIRNCTATGAGAIGAEASAEEKIRNCTATGAGAIGAEASAEEKIRY